MNRSNIKWLAGTATVLILTVLLVNIAAKSPLTSSSATTVTPIAPASTQRDDPTITWLLPELTGTMFPGTSSTTKVSFRSSENLTNVIVEVTPSLKTVLSVSPISVTSIAANQNYQLTFTLKAPPEFKKREFGGTIHLRNDGKPPKTYATPLAVDLKLDWNTIVDSANHFSFIYPFDWTQHTYENTRTISSPGARPALEGDPGNEIQILVLPFNGSPSLSAWLQDWYKGEIDWTTTHITSYPNPAGVQFSIIKGVPGLTSDNVNAYTLVAGQVVQVSVTPASKYESYFTTILSSFSTQ